jgi:hypothetical protein
MFESEAYPTTHFPACAQGTENFFLGLPFAIARSELNKGCVGQFSAIYLDTLTESCESGI